MNKVIIETFYPKTFREEDAKLLGTHIKNRRSVNLVGMKRVGISNFLRFFLYHTDIVPTYIDERKHVFIRIDLNDLVEREIFAFWTLTLKRIVDTTSELKLPTKIQKEIEQLFLSSIQSGDLFLTIDAVRKSLLILVQQDIVPTLFFLRFDRIESAATPEFFANVQGIIDATHHKVACVFTSYKGLDVLTEKTFTKASLSAFTETMYLKPAKKRDTEVIFTTYKSRYKIFLTDEIKEALFKNVDGYVQYLHLALIALQEKHKSVKNGEELFELLSKDERITLQSEELWESLNTEEKDILLKVVGGEIISPEEKKKAKYLWETGLLSESDSSVFSPLFNHFLSQRKKQAEGNGEFTKKELALFTYLHDNKDMLCEREKIIEYVWPEEEALGVSDWAMDRLVARVRNKLRQQKNNFEVQTIKTRGYKLVTTPNHRE